jgi:RNA polymerase sigma-70 factor (ECF subfamily)
VKTVPQSGETKVDSMTGEIRVTFSKEMKDKNWSWCNADEGEFPEMIGQPRYLEDKRTCVLSVKLKPQTTYAVWLNTDRFINFKDTGGRPAIPYLLVFETE